MSTPIRAKAAQRACADGKEGGGIQRDLDLVARQWWITLVHTIMHAHRTGGRLRARRVHGVSRSVGRGADRMGEWSAKVFDKDSTLDIDMGS
ncbi:hypothetical protein VTJ49DRAFT_7522 [Mycothermus thermophilus]|uniref:Uncharacterized protein n=1 Tax=Humicola insolens TaxID=85995 RepID=A0ABR3VQ93_HUMIN